MTERIAESNYQQLHHFISHSKWEAESVMAAVGRKTAHSLQSLNGSTGLILDESGNEKAGKKSVGVARQDIAQVGTVCNAQVAVFAALVRANRVGLVAGKLFLPKEWTDDVVRMSAAGIQKSEQHYGTKPELAAELIEQLPAEVSDEWVGGDTIYGNSPLLRKKLKSLGKAFVLDVGEQLKVYLTDPEPFLPTVDGGSRRGRKPKRLVSGQAGIELRQLGAEIGLREWQKIHYRNGTKERLVREAVLLPVFVWTGDTAEVEQLQLIISRE